jgi:hypothetical protein
MAQTLIKIASDFSVVLQSKVAIGDTTATLSSVLDLDGNSLANGSYAFTIDRNNSSKEYIICTITGTAVTSVYSISRQGVATSGFARVHRKGAEVIISDYAVIKRMLSLLDGTTGFDASTPLKYDGDPVITLDAQFATKKYVDDVAIAGAAKATDSVYGISKLSTPAVSSTVPIVVGDNDTRVPSQGENDALVGTSGTPGSSNKYVTNDDTATAATANKVPRRLSSGDITVPSTPTNSTDAISKNYADTTFVPLSTQTPAWGKVSTSTFSTSVTTATLTKVAEFTSLDGDTDDMYMILIEAQGAQGSNGQFGITFNNDAGANKYGYVLNRNSSASGTESSIASAGLSTNIVISGTAASISGDNIAGVIYIKSNKTITNTTRTAQSQLIAGSGGSDIAQQSSWGGWSDTTNNLTSIELRCYQDSGSTQTCSGKITLYKIIR